ncbi:F-box domain protein, partial [Ostertagia ostertagi]
EPFPWRRLPRELQIKVLQELVRGDLDRCQLVNRDMFKLVQNQWALLEKTIYQHFDDQNGALHEIFDHSIEISYQQITGKAVELYAKCSGESWSVLSARLKSRFLQRLSSCLLDAGCRVYQLSITRSSTESSSPSVLLQFLHDVNPAAIYIDGIHSWNSFSQEILQFIVTREHLHIPCFQNYPIPIDDNILAQLTAPFFFIGVPNMITLDGLRSFVESLASGEKKVEYGTIHTDFFINDALVPSAPNIVKVITGGFCIGLATERPTTMR